MLRWTVKGRFASLTGLHATLVEKKSAVGAREIIDG
jgi:hypothetical protein